MEREPIERMRGRETGPQLGSRLAILAVWLVAFFYLAWNHVFWRDEVRALSLALNGDGWAAMLRGVQGEGHPALWYILLRAAHDLVPVREVLPVMAGIVGVAAAVLLALRSPFAPWRIALILFGAFFLFEYSVSARNYGISMLLLFVIADRYARHRESGVLLGFLLALLCNTNVHSALLAAAMLLFWAIELITEDGLRWTTKVRTLAINAGIAAIGAGLCAITIYPPVNDAAVNAYPGEIGLGAIAKALSIPAQSLWSLAPAVLGKHFWAAPVLALAVVGAPLGLIRAPAAFLSSLAALAAFLLFFYIVYPGAYRHHSLYLVYLIAMYWLAALGRGGRWRTGRQGSDSAFDLPERIGGICFTLLLALQIPNAAAYLTSPAKDIPESRARDLGAMLRARGLDRNAIIVGNSDAMLEPLAYYTGNRLYFLRTKRFGTVAPFSKQAMKTISLGELLIAMRRLRAHHGVPVVAVMQYPLDPEGSAMTLYQGYVGNFSIDPGDVRAFKAATTRIASFGPAISDENYDVYLLR
ncbi:hypothetical protein ASG11_14390 [Sphingomonas sp. Leaf357]|uniref:hypothetical protein n=1 Tax=Sphingomonas sp. Leaf357 TaxID=1736350 RepID=UPI0006F68565|nr:hypothetical protein [Sphingomonas sp. Leaf357]KQS01995.1 hypothetical protein ASG11_14390 [Sphingomonas sp. Leaf357]